MSTDAIGVSMNYQPRSSQNGDDCAVWLDSEVENICIEATLAISGGVYDWPSLDERRALPGGAEEKIECNGTMQPNVKFVVEGGIAYWIEKANEPKSGAFDEALAMGGVQALRAFAREHHDGARTVATSSRGKF